MQTPLPPLQIFHCSLPSRENGLWGMFLEYSILEYFYLNMVNNTYISTVNSLAVSVKIRLPLLVQTPSLLFFSWSLPDLSFLIQANKLGRLFEYYLTRKFPITIMEQRYGSLRQNVFRNNGGWWSEPEANQSFNIVNINCSIVFVVFFCVILYWLWSRF